MPIHLFLKVFLSFAFHSPLHQCYNSCFNCQIWRKLKMRRNIYHCIYLYFCLVSFLPSMFQCSFFFFFLFILIAIYSLYTIPPVDGIERINGILLFPFCLKYFCSYTFKIGLHVTNSLSILLFKNMISPSFFF